MLDVAGAVDAQQGETVRNAELRVTLALVCRSPEEVCQKAPTLRPAHITIPVSPRVKLSWNPWSYDGSTFTRVTVDGVERTLVTGQQRHRLEIPDVPWEEADLLIAFPRQTTASRNLQVIQLRASLLQGEFTEIEPSPRSRLRAWLRPLGIGSWTIALAGLAMLGMGFIAWRELRAGRSEHAPHVFGALLFLWGWMLAAVPLVLYLWQGDARGMLYYTATGLFFALSGLYAFFGRAAAKFWYTTAYVLALGWTFVEWDVTSRQFFMQLGMPTLIGAYMWHLARTGRLESSQ
jgi:hypothetical protein